jgi:ubiquinone/menaquinone biosynthesis C-methylase UbiE
MSSSATPEFAARIAERYDALRASDDYHYLSDRLVAAGDLAQRRVLDIGCGTGMFAADLAERHGCIVWGVDQSPEMLAVAEERANARVRFERAAAERLPFADGSFERATMVSVAHHLDRPRRSPKRGECWRPGGDSRLRTPIRKVSARCG